MVVIWSELVHFSRSAWLQVSFQDYDVGAEAHIFFFLIIFYIGVSQLGSSLVAQLVKNLPTMQETLVWFLGRKSPWRRDRLPTPVFLGFPGGSDGKESTCNVGDLGSIPGLGRSPGGWQPTPVFLPGDFPMDRVAWWAIAMGWQRVGHDWATQHSNIAN